MIRLARTFAWLVGSAVALAVFVWLGTISPATLNWHDLGGWLNAVPSQDALVELARCLGLALSAYVLLVAFLALLGDIAMIFKAVSLARVLHATTRLIAVPALRRRLAGASMSAVLTVSAGMSSLGSRASAAAPAVVQVTGVRPSPTRAPVSLLPVGVSAGDVVGFGLDSSAFTSVPSGTQREVHRGDTIWGLSTSVYGFCTPEIAGTVAAASGVTDPSLIFVGQTLVFPDLTTQATSPPDTDGVPSRAIQRGDTLWRIVEHHYGRVDAALVNAVTAFNGITDPSDIPVGFVVLLPPLQAEASPTVVIPSPPTPEPAVAEPPSVSLAPDVAPPLEVPTVSPGSPTPEVTAAADPSGTAADAGPTGATQAPHVFEEEGVGSDSSSVPIGLGLVASATLAAGLLGASRVLRRRQRAAGAHAWRPALRGRPAQLHAQLVAVADLSLTRWANQELADLMSRPESMSAGPVAVEISQRTGIEVLWDGPAPVAPAPWEATPGGGWSWQLLYDPDAEVPAEELPAPIPGLVTFGTRHGAQVLIDLESFGSVAIAGDPRAAEDLVRSIVLELGSGEELSDARVFTLGMDIDGVEHLQRVQSRSLDFVLRHARATVDDVRSVCEAAGVTDTLGLRTTPDGIPREVTVVVLRNDVGPVVEELVSLAQPRTGLVVVVVGAVDDAGLDVVVGAGGEVELATLGMTLEGVGLSRETAANLAVVLDALAQPVEQEEGSDGPSASAPPDLESARQFLLAGGAAEQLEDEDAVPLDGTLVDLDVAAELLDEPDRDTDWALPEPSILVRVLGRPEVGPLETELTRYERRILIYVASVGGVADGNALRNAVWEGTLVSDKRVWNCVSTLRTKLGAHVCPDRRSGPRLVRLVGVQTDLDLFEALTTRAQDVSSSEALALLLQALDMVKGQPFDDVTCEWAFDTQLTYVAAQLIENAAVRAVELALAENDPVTARRALAQGLLAMPGNEVLYRERMRIEAHVGNRAGVRKVYGELLAVLADLGSVTGDNGDPSPATRRLFEQLVGGPPSD